MFKYLDELDKYKQYWFVTITPYGKDIEPNVPDKEKVIESFKKLSEHIGADAIGWRYDPIFIGSGFDVNKHIECFEKIARQLKNYTHNCTISFLDLYEKVKRNAPNIKPHTQEEQIEIAKAFYKIGTENNMTIHSCCTCGHLCKYCYANANKGLVIENMKQHNENSPFLIGGHKEGHKIAKSLGYHYSVVLGSEKYYPKSGYIPAINYGIKAPFDVANENFMAIKLNETNEKIEGIVRYAKEFGI